MNFLAISRRKLLVAGAASALPSWPAWARSSDDAIAPFTFRASDAVLADLKRRLNPDPWVAERRPPVRRRDWAADRSYRTRRHGGGRVRRHRPLAAGLWLLWRPDPKTPRSSCLFGRRGEHNNADTLLLTSRKISMLIEHAGKRPHIDPSAWVAPDATVCGDVTLGAGTRILHGARIIGEGGGAIRIGLNCIVMENADALLVPFPRACLIPWETPLELQERLGAKLGISLRVKRDDLTGLAFGGNKVRLFPASVDAPADHRLRTCRLACRTSHLDLRHLQQRNRQPRTPQRRAEPG
jgi:hypothetical protein